MKKANMDLEKYAEEGWRARIKPVKGRKYVVIRLRGKDKSLGPYAEELWQKCVQLGMVKKDPKDVEELKRTVEELSQRLNETSMLLEEKGAEFEELRKKGVKDHRVLNANLKSIITNQKSITESLTVYQKSVITYEKILNDTPLAGIRSEYKCSSCGSIGLVAANIRCTKCNTEDWWGWRPK